MGLMGAMRELGSSGGIGDTWGDGGNRVNRGKLESVEATWGNRKEKLGTVWRNWR